MTRGRTETLDPTKIAVGDELPRFDLPVTAPVIVAGAIASRDLLPAHPEMADLQARVGRFEERVRKKRELVADVMEQAGLRKLVEPDFTVSLRPGRAPLVVLDEEAVPRDFWKPQSPKLDRQGLIAALAGGRDIPGALLGNPPMSLSVRTK